VTPQKRTKLLTLTGPSGSGKTTLLNRLVADHGFKAAVSHTTRQPRAGEVDGVDYHFITGEKFNEMFYAGEFLEHVSFKGNLYGVSKRAVVPDNPEDHIVIIVEPHGLRQIQDKLEDDGGDKIISVYLQAEAEILIDRYLSRMTQKDLDDPEGRNYHAKRILNIEKEVDRWFKDNEECYCLVVNQNEPEDIDKAIPQILGMY